MRNEPMEPKVESQDAKDEDSNTKKNYTGPAEEPRKESQCRKRMTDDKPGKRVSLEPPHAFSIGSAGSAAKDTRLLIANTLTS